MRIMQIIMYSESQVISVPSSRAIPLYPFLSRPPPQKRRPTQPLPPTPTGVLAAPHQAPAGRRRSATTIAAWVANVHPGSPAPRSPYSPRRSPSAFSRRPSLSRSIPRRSSVSSVRVASASFLNMLDTPTTASRQVITPSIKEFGVEDLAVAGYTSVFVHGPETPLSPGPTRPVPFTHALPAPSTSSPPVKVQHKGLKHFRSLGALKVTRRTRSRSIVAPPSPPVLKALSSVEAKRIRAAKSTAVAKAKKSKYAKFRPPPLGTELALAQLMDGGKMEDHIARFAQAQAKAGGAVKVNGQLVGVGSVWRDGEGGVWRDEDEEWEYAHLLGGDESYGYCGSEASWVRFGSEAGRKSDCMVVDERRESVSTQDSDLHPRFAMHAETDPQDDLAGFGGNVVPTACVKPGMSVLAMPSRSRRNAKHLRKPEFLLDVFPVPGSAMTTLLPKSPLSPQFGVASTRHVAVRSVGRARHRPTPLKLMPPSPLFLRPSNPADVGDVRRNFLDGSFAPTVPSGHRAAGVAETGVIALTDAKESRKPSALKGFLRAFGGRRRADP